MVGNFYWSKRLKVLIVGVLIFGLVFCPYSGANAVKDQEQISASVNAIPKSAELGSAQDQEQVSADTNTIPQPIDLSPTQIEASTETATKTNGMVHGVSSNGNLMLLAPKQVQTYRVPPIEVWVPITILALSNPATLGSIKATIEGSESITQVATELIPVNRSLAEVLSAMQDPESTSFAGLMEKTYQTTLKIDVSSMNLKEGSIIPISIEVVSSTNSGLEETIQTQIEYSVLALPQVRNGGEYNDL